MFEAELSCVLAQNLYFIQTGKDPFNLVCAKKLV